MAAQSLTYGLSGNGAFNDPAVWTPREAPTPNSNQRLQVAAGTLVVNTQPWQDYDLAVTGPAVVVFANETLDAASTVRVATPAATFGVAGAGLNSFADMAVGGSGAQATLNVQIDPGTAFINNGAVEVNGNFLVRGDGAFVNNGSLTVENGTASIQTSAFGLSVSSFVIGKAGTLEIGGFTNAVFAFEPGVNGRLVFATAGTEGGAQAVRGFDAGDQIVVQGAVAALEYQGTAAGGTLFLGGANGTLVGQIAFAGGYSTAAFGIAVADGRTTITTNVAPPKVEPATPPSATAAASALTTANPVLDLDFHGRRDAQYSVAGPNDVTLAMTKLTVRDTALSRADFLDGALVFDGANPNGHFVPNEDAAAVARMYYTVLGRAPEFAGVHYWVHDVMEARNLSIRDLAPGFYTSPEFTARYGTGTTDQQFVSLLYRNVLGRDAEPGGIAFWTDSLARGTGRAEVVVAISESYEHQVIRYAAIEQNGILFADHPFL